MNLLHRIASELTIRRREAAIARDLSRLSDHSLADLGLSRFECAQVARIGARLGPAGAPLLEVVARVRAEAADRRDRAGFLRPMTDALSASSFGRSIRLRLVWLAAQRQIRRELHSYSDRELMADLRLTRSQIDEVAAEAADDKVAAFVAANPAYRQVRFWAGSMGRAAG